MRGREGERERVREGEREGGREERERGDIKKREREDEGEREGRKRRDEPHTGRACTLTCACACVRAECDDVVIVGDAWGDESATFLRSIDLMVKIGGGAQSVK